MNQPTGKFAEHLKREPWNCSPGYSDGREESFFS